MTYQHPPPSKATFGERFNDCFRGIFCCGCQDDDDEGSVGKPLVISGPTDFRREEIRIPGMDPTQERYIREKAARDAKQLYANLRPLGSSPSGTFAERPASTYMLPSYEQFTQPRQAPSPSSPPSRIDRVMAHGRKLSDNFKNSIGASGGNEGGVEMRSLMEGDKNGNGGNGMRPGVEGLGLGKTSEDSFARTTLTEESAERDLDAQQRSLDVKL